MLTSSSMVTVSNTHFCKDRDFTAKEGLSDQFCAHHFVHSPQMPWRSPSVSRPPIRSFARSMKKRNEELSHVCHAWMHFPLMHRLLNWRNALENPDRGQEPRLRNPREPKERNPEQPRRQEEEVSDSE